MQALDGNQQDLGDLSNAASIRKAAHNHPTTVDIYVNIYLYMRTKANMHWLESMMKPLGIGCSIMVNMWHFAEWLLWLRVHPFNCREVGPGLPLPRSHCRPWQFHHQLTFLRSQIILNWEAFKMPLILIMSHCNMTVTVVWESGSQIWKIDES